VFENRSINRRLPMECEEEAVQSGSVPRPCRCRLHVVAASRRLSSQHLDLGIAMTFS